jgi:hypothetical protein
MMTGFVSFLRSIPQPVQGVLWYLFWSPFIVVFLLVGMHLLASVDRHNPAARQGHAPDWLIYSVCQHCHLP